MKKINIFLFFFVAIFSVFGYAKDKGIDVVYPQGEGTLNLVSKIDSLRVLSNVNIPKAVFMGLVNLRPYYPLKSALNGDFAAKLYEIVYSINKSENLEDSTSGKNQDIDFVVAGSSRRMELLIDSISETIDSPDALQYLVPINVDTLVDGGVLFDRWFQDWGEFIGVGQDADGNLVSGVYYVNRNRGLESLVKEISKMLDIPFIRSDSYSGSTGNYGGNIELTPDGTLFYGSTMDETQEKQLLATHKEGNAVKLTTDWLSVGHVDEQISIISSVKRNTYPKNYSGGKVDYAVVVADPVMALKVIYEYEGTQESISYLADYIPQNNTDFNPTIDKLSIFKIESIKRAIGWFLQDKEKFIFKNAVISDELGNRIINKKLVRYCARKAKVTRRFCTLVAYNLLIHEKIEMNLVNLTLATPTINDQVVRVPQIYRESLFLNKPDGSISFLPGTVNMLVLRDHLIIPDPTFDGFRDVIQRDLGRVVGGNDKIHFILEKAEYHEMEGEIHCGTNVFREIDQFFHF